MSVVGTTSRTPDFTVRHPLGLPPGSIRAVLTLMIAGLFWTVLVMSQTKPEVEVPLFLYFLTGMILLFIGSHGHTIGSHTGQGSPLNLPRGSLRAILILGAAGLAGWLYYKDPGRLQDVLTPEASQLVQWPALLLATVGGYLLGYLIGRGPWRRAVAFQDLLAWVSLLAMVGLVIETIWVLFINPSLEVPFDLRTFEAILTAIVSIYYGARS